MTSSGVEIEAGRQSIEVEVPIAEAFRIFVDEIDSWWPLATHSVGRQRATGCVFEGSVGGRIYEIQDDDSIHLWGTVAAWDPPARVVFSWHPGRDSDTAQEVELSFEESVAGRTLVELVHRGWERLGERGVEARKAYQTGWPGVLSGYVSRCSASK